MRNITAKLLMTMSLVVAGVGFIGAFVGLAFLAQVMLAYAGFIRRQ